MTVESKFRDKWRQSAPLEDNISLPFVEDITDLNSFLEFAALTRLTGTNPLVEDLTMASAMCQQLETIVILDGEPNFLSDLSALAFACVQVRAMDKAAQCRDRLRQRLALDYSLTGVKNAQGKNVLKVQCSTTVVDSHAQRALLFLEALIHLYGEAKNDFARMTAMAFLAEIINKDDLRENNDDPSKRDQVVMTAVFYAEKGEATLRELLAYIEDDAMYEPTRCVLLPTVRQVKQSLAQLLVASHRLTDAIPLFRHLHVPMELAKALMALGRRDEAIQVLRAEPPQGPLLGLLGQLEGDATIVERAWTEFGHRPSLLLLGQQYLKTDQADKGEACVAEFLRGDALNVDALILLGHAQLQQRKLAEAAKTWRRCTHLEPESIISWTNLGACQFELGQHANALQSFKQAARLDFHNAKLWSNVLRAAELCHSQCDIEYARERLK